MTPPYDADANSYDSWKVAIDALRGLTMLGTFIDIDGTLTDQGAAGGNPIESRLATVRGWIKAGRHIVIWSATGHEYAKAFALTNGLDCVAVGKPEICIDDNAEIRPGGLTAKVISPEKAF